MSAVTANAPFDNGGIKAWHGGRCSRSAAADREKSEYGRHSELVLPSRTSSTNSCISKSTCNSCILIVIQHMQLLCTILQPHSMYKRNTFCRLRHSPPFCFFLHTQTKSTQQSGTFYDMLYLSLQQAVRELLTNVS